MKTLLKSTLLVLFVFTLGAFAQESAPSPSPAPAPSVADISGKWNLQADAGGQIIDIVVEIKQTGDTFTGTSTSMIGNGTIEAGKVTGKTFAAVLKSDVQGQMTEFRMEGSITEGAKMSGTFASSSFGSVPFSAAKEKK